MLFVCFCLRGLLPLEVRYSPRVSFSFKRCSPPALNTCLYECERSEVLVSPGRSGNHNGGSAGWRLPCAKPWPRQPACILPLKMLREEEPGPLGSASCEVGLEPGRPPALTVPLLTDAVISSCTPTIFTLVPGPGPYYFLFHDQCLRPSSPVA